MSLQVWLAKGWIREHQTSPEEIRNLLGLADRDLASSQVAGLPAEWRLIIAYNSALQSAAAALAADGFKASPEAAHHYYVIESLRHTLGAEAKLIIQFDRFRKKRNISAYDRAGVVSDKEAEEMAGLARELRGRVQDWLERTHPELL